MAQYDNNILHQIADIEKQSFSEGWSYESLADTLSYDYNRLFVDMDKDTVTGYLIANLLGDESELLRIAVRKDRRRCGTAAGLMEQYFSATSHECRRYLLEVRQSNEAAKSLYGRYGYREIACRPNYYSNPVEDAVIYERGNNCHN